MDLFCAFLLQIKKYTFLHIMSIYQRIRDAVHSNAECRCG